MRARSEGHRSGVALTGRDLALLLAEVAAVALAVFCRVLFERRRLSWWALMLLVVVTLLALTVVVFLATARSS